MPAAGRAMESGGPLQVGVGGVSAGVSDPLGTWGPVPRIGQACEPVNVANGGLAGGEVAVGLSPPPEDVFDQKIAGVLPQDSQALPAEFPVARSQPAAQRVAAPIVQTVTITTMTRITTITTVGQGQAAGRSGAFVSRSAASVRYIQTAPTDLRQSPTTAASLQIGVHIGVIGSHLPRTVTLRKVRARGSTSSRDLGLLSLDLLDRELASEEGGLAPESRQNSGGGGRDPRQALSEYLSSSLDSVVAKEVEAPRPHPGQVPAQDRLRGRGPQWLEDSLSLHYRKVTPAEARARAGARPNSVPAATPSAHNGRRQMPDWVRLDTRGPGYLGGVARIPAQPAELGVSGYTRGDAGRVRPLAPATPPLSRVMSLVFRPVSAQIPVFSPILDVLHRQGSLFQDRSPLLAPWVLPPPPPLRQLSSTPEPANGSTAPWQPANDQRRGGSGGGGEQRQESEPSNSEEGGATASTRTAPDLQALQLNLEQSNVLQGTQLTEFVHKYAVGSIQSLLKKAHRVDDLADLDGEQALRSLLLVLKIGGEFTYAHSARVLSLAMELADQIGADAEQRNEIAQGCLLKDIGEAGLLLRRESPAKQESIGSFLQREAGSQDLRKAGILHDIGKVRIPAEILYKPGKLTEAEYELMKLHPIFGEEIVFPIPALRHLCPAIRSHHERWDGKGYPDGLSGNAIPLAARVIAVADVFDALEAARPYKEGMPVEKVRTILREGRGTHFDPALLDAFEKVLQRRYPELG